MAWLFLDTHAKDRVVYAWIEGGRVTKRVEKEGRATVLLPLIAKNMKKIEGVAVVAGPGSFSAVRTGVIDANLISRLLHVPLVGLSVDEASDLDHVAQTLCATGYVLRDYVAPVYDAEPNITVPKPV